MKKVQYGAFLISYLYSDIIWVDPGTMWYCQDSALLFKRMMLKPNSIYF